MSYLKQISIFFLTVQFSSVNAALDCSSLLGSYEHVLNMDRFHIQDLMAQGHLADLSEDDKLVLRERDVIRQFWNRHTDGHFRVFRFDPTAVGVAWIIIKVGSQYQIYYHHGEYDQRKKFKTEALKRVVDPGLFETILRLEFQYRLIQVRDEGDFQIIEFSSPKMFYHSRTWRPSTLDTNDVRWRLNQLVFELPRIRNELKRLAIEFKEIEPQRRYQMTIPRTAELWSSHLKNTFSGTPFSHIQGVIRSGIPTTAILQYARAVRDGFIPLSEVIAPANGLAHDLGNHFRGFARLPKRVWQWYQKVFGAFLEEYEQAQSLSERDGAFWKLELTVASIDSLTAMTGEEWPGYSEFDAERFFLFRASYALEFTADEFSRKSLAELQILRNRDFTEAVAAAKTFYSEVEKFRAELHDNIVWLNR